MTRIPAPFLALGLGLARIGNIRQRLSTVPTQLPGRFAGAEIDQLSRENDAIRESAEKDEKIVTRGMQWLQGCLAWPWLALHMQQDYLAVIEGISLRFVQTEN